MNTTSASDIKKARPRYRYCAVPNCTTSNTDNSTTKLFFSSPMDRERRINWLKAINRSQNDFSWKYNFSVCEDHFNLETDLENYMKFKYYNTRKKVKKLKPHVVPHIFQFPLDTLSSEQKKVRRRPRTCNVTNTDYRKGNSSILFFDFLPDSKELESVSKCKPTKPKRPIRLPVTITQELGKLAIYLCEHKPETYLGVAKNSATTRLLYLLVKMAEQTKQDVYVTLQKIKLHPSFEVLADRFGLPEHIVVTKFKRVVSKLATILTKFVIWPSTNEIEIQLPPAFLADYSNVRTVINYLEIEIQQPLEAMKQILTWSESRACNSIKYLIASTPNGFVTFVSQGFGGRTTDLQVIQYSKLLEKIPENSVLMAGNAQFEGVDDILWQSRGCTLVRIPPSVLGPSMQLTNAADNELRTNNSIVVDRLREFDLLKPRACVSGSLIKKLDQAVIVVAALNNFRMKNIFKLPKLN